MKMLQSRGLPMKQEPIAGPVAQLMDCLYWQLVQEWGIPITKDDDGALSTLVCSIDRHLADAVNWILLVQMEPSEPFEIW
jgi:hypothetical protein